MGRRVRGLLLAAVLAGAAVLLGACEQPLPKITVQTAAFSTTITPSLYCFDVGQCRGSRTLDFPIVNVAATSTVLIDVPRAVADTGWIVKVFALTGGKASSGLSGLKPIGQTRVIRDLQTYRVAGSSNDGNAFIVEVNQVRGARSDGSTWSFLAQTPRI